MRPGTNDMTETRKYRLNPEAEILPLDTSLEEQMYQLRIGDLRYRINENALVLLRQFDEEQAEEELDRALKNTQAVGLNANGLKDFFLQKRILISESPPPGQKPLSNKHPLALRLSLVSQRRLRPFTSRLAILFMPRIALCLTAFIVLSHALFLYYAYPLLHSLPSVGQWQWIMVLTACYGIMVVHELGHSSACTHYGAHHDDIGIGIYFIYPVLYANVTDCWRLPRTQRMVVDIAGIYFQLVASSICSVLWLHNHQPVMLLIVCSSLATAIVNLNPFLRLDGYWLLTDITALPSLHRSNQELWRYWWIKLRRNDRAARRPEFFSASPWIKTAFVAYSICSLSFFGFFFGRLIILLVPYLIHQVPRTLALILSMVAAHQFDAKLVSAIFSMTGLSITSFGVLMMAKRPVRRVFQLVHGICIKRFVAPDPKTVKELQVH